MSLSDKWDDFANSIMAGVKDLAKSEGQDFIKRVQSDATDFITETTDKLQEWTNALARGDLSQDEFIHLVKGQKELAQMNALTELGISKTKIQRFRDDLINLVSDSALKAIGL